MDKNEALAWALTVPGVTRAWWSPLEDEMWPILKSDLVCEAPQTVATPEVIPDLARPAPDLPAKVESAVSDQAPKSPEVRKDFFVLAPIQQFIDVVIEPPRRHF